MKDDKETRKKRSLRRKKYRVVSRFKADIANNNIIGVTGETVSLNYYEAEILFDHIEEI